MKNKIEFKWSNITSNSIDWYFKTHDRIYILKFKNNKLIEFISPVYKFSTDLEWDFYDIFNSFSTRKMIDSNVMDVIITALYTISKNRSFIKEDSICQNVWDDLK